MIICCWAENNSGTKNSNNNIYEKLFAYRKGFTLNSEIDLNYDETF